MFTKRQRVYRFNRESDTVQRLFTEYMLFNRVIFRRFMDEETVPVYAWAAHACLGYTDWKSKFYHVINEQNS
jgi:hypothetical protein